MHGYISLYISIVVLHYRTVAALVVDDVIEPQCFSRFDYEYKVLQRLIQIEERQKYLTEALKAREREIGEQRDEINKLTNTINTSHKTVEDMVQAQRGPLVAFSAFIDSSTTVTMSSTTVFNKILFNEPSAYDESTGVFTCPVEGIYMLYFVIASRGAEDTLGQLKINNIVVLEAVSDGKHSDQDLQGSNLAVMKLSKGDEVSISGDGRLPGDSFGRANTRVSSFSGVLLRPL